MITLIKNKIIDLCISIYKLIKGLILVFIEFIKDLYAIIRYWN